MPNMRNNICFIFSINTGLYHLIILKRRFFDKLLTLLNHHISATRQRFRMPCAFWMKACLRHLYNRESTLYFYSCPKLGESQAKPEVVVTVIWSVVVTVRQTAVPRIVVPATATVHTARPTIGFHPLSQIRQAFLKFQDSACFTKATKGSKCS